MSRFLVLQAIGFIFFAVLDIESLFDAIKISWANDIWRSSVSFSYMQVVSKIFLDYIWEKIHSLYTGSKNCSPCPPCPPPWLSPRSRGAPRRRSTRRSCNGTKVRYHRAYHNEQPFFITSLCIGERLHAVINCGTLCINDISMDAREREREVKQKRLILIVL